MLGNRRASAPSTCNAGIATTGDHERADVPTFGPRMATRCGSSARTAAERQFAAMQHSPSEMGQMRAFPPVLNMGETGVTYNRGLRDVPMAYVFKTAIQPKSGEYLFNLEMCPVRAAVQFTNGRTTMNRRSIFTLSAIAALELALLSNNVIAQQGTLKQQLVGAWTLVSCDNMLGNAKAPYCVNPKGILILDASGQYATMVFAGGRSNATTEGTNAANFGTWSVNEADKTITRRFVGALNPANEGKAETKNSVSLSGDELKLGGQSSLPSGEVRTNSVYRRVK